MLINAHSHTHSSDCCTVPVVKLFEAIKVTFMMMDAMAVTLLSYSKLYLSKVWHP